MKEVFKPTEQESETKNEFGKEKEKEKRKLIFGFTFHRFLTS